MARTTDLQPLKRRVKQSLTLIALGALVIYGTLCLPCGAAVAEPAAPASSEQAGKPPEAAEQQPKLSEVAELKQKAQDAFIHGQYPEAAAFNLKIARKYPAAKERHYAVQMLGTIYENNLVDLRKAVQWNREFLRKYADSRQAPLYQEKLARLAGLEQAQGQEEAYKLYQKIRFANKGDAYQVEQYEALLKEHPAFSLKAEVEKEIAYAYARMSKPQQSYAAFQAISTQTGHKLSSTDRILAEANRSYWKMTTIWKWVALAVVAVLWGSVLLMQPWKRLDRALIKTFLFWTLGWVLLMASRMPTFYSMETDGYQFVIRDRAIYTMAALNLPVLLWLMLFNRGEFWRNRRRTLRLVSPLLTLVMTVAVIYLFIAYQPNGPEIVSVFGVKYEYLIGELRKGM